jgi:hypothetical protein
MSEPIDAIPAEPLPPKSSPLGRLIGVLIAPDKTMKSIAERPDWVVPFLVIIVLLTISSALVTPHLDLEEMLRAKWAEKGVPEDRIEDMLDKYEHVSGVVAPVSTFVMTGVMLALGAAGAMLALRAFGGVGTYLQNFAVTCYSTLPYVIKSIILTLLVLPRGKLTPDKIATLLPTSLAFLGDMKESPVLFALLASIDLFSFWMLFLLVTGLSYVAKFSKPQTAGIVVTLWFLLVAIRATFAGF